MATYKIFYLFTEKIKGPFLIDGNTEIKNGKGSLVIAGEKLSAFEALSSDGVSIEINRQVMGLGVTDFNYHLTGIQKIKD